MRLVDQFADVIERRAREAIEDEAAGYGPRPRGPGGGVGDLSPNTGVPAKLLLVQAVGLGTVFERKRMEVTDRFRAADPDLSG